MIQIKTPLQFEPIERSILVARKKPSRPYFDLAQPQDDEALRRLLLATPMKGSIEVSFLKDPNYFSFNSILGEKVQTLVLRDRDQIAGMAVRASRPSFINGEREVTGYLGDLRLHPDYRSGTYLYRGYQFLRDLHEADRSIRYYSTVIFSDNYRALKTIASNRSGMPWYTDMGRLLTPMIRIPKVSKNYLAFEKTLNRKGYRIERGSAEVLPLILSKLNASRNQFAPQWTPHDFLNGSLKEFSLDDFYLLFKGQQLSAFIGVWDQQKIRQTKIEAYHGLLKYARPLVNSLFAQALPKPGSRLPFFYGAFAESDDKESFEYLLEYLRRKFSGSNYSHFSLSLHEKNPLSQVIQCFPHTPFVGRIFSVTFERLPKLDSRLPSIEAALL